MTQRKVLSSRSVNAENQVEMLNREIVPVLRQVVKSTTVTGSRSGATVLVLTSLLTILSNAGIITDQTTP